MSLKRWTPWITLAISAAILFMLSRVLRQYDFAEVLRALVSVDRSRLALAIACVAGSYFSLTLFDTLAVRYVRHALPYRRTAIASFTGLSIGHNVGLAALSSGAIRYRFYSRWGLSAMEIAKVIVFCALTVALGLLTLGGLAWTLRPRIAADLTGLPLPAVYVIGITCLVLSATWLVLAAGARRPIRIRRWALSIPPLRLAAAQIVVGTMNFAFVTAALHQCILTVAEARFVEVAAVYVIGNSAAIASHVPGGLGVIEGVVMYLLPQANLLSAVILFRAVYYLLPLPLGAVCFLAAEIYFRGRSGQAGPHDNGPSFGGSHAPVRR
jgi:uncharacterized membrane protein YbhN (UPF0104 family)